MIFNNLTFPDTKLSKDQFVLGAQLGFASIRVSRQQIYENNETRDISQVKVSQSKILETCIVRALFTNVQKWNREKDFSTASEWFENLLKMCTLDAVVRLKPLF